MSKDVKSNSEESILDLCVIISAQEVRIKKRCHLLGEHTSFVDAEKSADGAPSPIFQALVGIPSSENKGVNRFHKRQLTLAIIEIIFILVVFVPNASVSSVCWHSEMANIYRSMICVLVTSGTIIVTAPISSSSSSSSAATNARCASRSRRFHRNSRSDAVFSVHSRPLVIENVVPVRELYQVAHPQIVPKVRVEPTDRHRCRPASISLASRHRDDNHGDDGDRHQGGAHDQE